MKVLLVGNYVPDRQESMQRFARLMGEGLGDLGHDVRLVRPEAWLGGGSRGGSFAKWLGYVDKYLIFPWRLRREVLWADLVHICDHSNAPYVWALAGRPHVVTCHDVLAIRSARGEFPGNPTGLTGKVLQTAILAGLRRAHWIACDSHATQEDLKQLGPSDTSVIVLGTSHPFAPMDRSEAVARVSRLGVGSDRPFILHVGGDQWYKNRFGLLQIFKQLLQYPGHEELRLVLVGPPLAEVMQTFVQDHGLTHQVICLADVPSDDLMALYSTAEALLFPSLAEGFGWPVLEAQACGCPVITTNRPPMTEVGGEAALYIEPEDPQAAAATIASRWANLAALVPVGLLNTGRFANHPMFDAYVSLYERLKGQEAAQKACVS